MVDDFHAQFGEDRILDRLFSGKRDGVCVEVGGFDGVTGSNSFHFEKLGWTCVVVEPDPELCARISASRPRAILVPKAASDAAGTCILHRAAGVETLSTIELSDDHRRRVVGEHGGRIEPVEVARETLDAMLAQNGIERIDFISIDVEGHELGVLRGFDLGRFAPRVVLIENNEYESGGELARYFRERGYRRFRVTGCNDWYARATDRELVTAWRALACRMRHGLRKLKYRLGRSLRRRPVRAP